MKLTYSYRAENGRGIPALARIKKDWRGSVCWSLAIADRSVYGWRIGRSWNNLAGEIGFRRGFSIALGSLYFTVIYGRLRFDGIDANNRGVNPIVAESTSAADSPRDPKEGQKFQD
jgi:hypothetical protein